MASPKQRQATRATFVAVLMLSTPAQAVVISDGRSALGGMSDVTIGEVAGGACKVPPRNRAVPFNLAPEAKLVDVVRWISPIICERFVVRGAMVTQDRRLTLVAPGGMTPNEAYRLFLGALDSIGLGVERFGTSLHIVNKGTRPPRVVAPESFVTVLVRWRDLPPVARDRLQEWLAQRPPGEVCDCNALAAESVVVSDLRSNVERLLGRRLDLPLPASRGEGTASPR